jgi:endo-1,4-beta-D-glucanase Y
MRLIQTPSYLMSALAILLVACTEPAPHNIDEAQDVIDSFADESLFFTGDYKNWFVELGIASEEEVTAKINQAYENYFNTEPTVTGVEPDDPAVQNDYALLYPVGEDMAFINAFDSKDIRSEGQSFGMAIALMMNDQETFNKLWKFAKTNIQNSSGHQIGYFAWQLSNEAPYNVIDENPAPDGDQWMAHMLFMAHNRWGSGDGIFNYSNEANQLLVNFVFRPESESSYPIMNIQHQMVTFVNTKGLHQFTNPSYHLPAFYELWASWANDNNEYWHNAAQISRDFLAKNAHPTTGLFSEYSSFSGVPEVTDFNEYSHRSAYDSYRVIANLMMDYMWVSRDETVYDLATRNLDHLAYVDQYQGGYKAINEVDGTPIADYKSPGQLAMNAAGAIMYDDAYRKEFLTQLWNVGQPKGQYRYYDGMLYMMGLLHVSGNFKIYGDGVIDSDNDGVGDAIDAFPLDPAEWADYDQDTIGNNADNDDDNDGVIDSDDAFPTNENEYADFDGDGVGNNADDDDDNDGISDSEDDFPFDSKSYDFSEAFTNDIVGWEFYNDMTTVTATLTHNVATKSLRITPSWKTSADQFTVKYRTFPDLNFTSGLNLSIDLKVNSAYTANNKLEYQLFLEDANGQPAYLGANTVPALSGSEFVTITANDIDEAYFDLAGYYKSDSFDFTRLAGVGIQFIANGKPVSVVGDIEVDNVKVDVPPALENVLLDNSANIDNWAAQTDNVNEGSRATAALSHNATEGVLVITPTWGSADHDKLSVIYKSFYPRDITAGVRIELSVKVDQNYIDDGNLRIQLVMLDDSSRPAYFKTITIDQLSSSSFTAIFEDISPSYSYGYKDPSFDFSNVASLGLQVSSSGKPIGVTGDIEVNYMSLSY